MLKLGVQLVHTATELGNGIQFHVSQGEYNGMVGQELCEKCPEGLYVQVSRVDPAICPPGYVCSQSGLDAPNARCPAGFFCPNGTLTTDPFRNDTTLRPYPCQPGTYCMGGVGYDTISQGDFFICPSVY